MLIQEDTNIINSVTKQHIKPPPKPDDESYKAALEEVKNKIDKLQDELVSCFNYFVHSFIYFG